jgi:hypothetical protein
MTDRYRKPCPLGQRSPFPGVVAGFGNAQAATHKRDRERGLLRVDELEHWDRADRLRLPSLAKRTAAALEIYTPPSGGTVLEARRRTV